MMLAGHVSWMLLKSFVLRLGADSARGVTTARAKQALRQREPERRTTVPNVITSVSSILQPFKQPPLPSFSIASASNPTLATVAANYGLKTVVDQHSLDVAARITPLEVDTKVANALLGVVTATALA